jgi:hypothetical protein
VRSAGEAPVDGPAQASLVAYDLLRFQGENWRSMPLEVRRAQLESVVGGIDAIKFSEAIEGDGAIVFSHACKLGLEGIVSSLGSRRRCGTKENRARSLAADPLGKATFKLAEGKGAMCMASDPGNCQTLCKCTKLEWDEAARASGHAEQWEKLFAAN